MSNDNYENGFFGVFALANVLMIAIMLVFEIVPIGLWCFILTFIIIIISWVGFIIEYLRKEGKEK